MYLYLFCNMRTTNGRPYGVGVVGSKKGADGDCSFCALFVLQKLLHGLYQIGGDDVLDATSVVFGNGIVCA